jgi:hypothetical protein
VRGLQTQAEVKILGVSERLLDGEPSTVPLCEPAEGTVKSLREVTKHQGSFMALALTTTTAGTSKRSSVTLALRIISARPVGKTQPLAVRASPWVILDADVAAEADVKVPAVEHQKLVELLVAEAPIGQQLDRHVRVEPVMQPLDERVLDAGTSPAKLALLHGLPDHGGGPTVPGHQVRAQRRVVVVVELGPVQCDDDLLARGHDELHPLLLDRLDIDAGVTQQPVDLLDARSCP